MDRRGFIQSLAVAAIVPAVAAVPKERPSRWIREWVNGPYGRDYHLQFIKDAETGWCWTPVGGYYKED